MSCLSLKTQTLPDLTETEFRLLSRLIYQQSGINLGDQKQPLMRARLAKRLRVLGLPTFRKYYDYVTRHDEGGKEMIQMLDAISTNLTEFFREPHHFTYLKNVLFPRLRREPSVRILCAGCSTGEEPYSVAIVARESFSDAAQIKVRITAGDISTRALARAEAGLYAIDRLRGIPMERLCSSFLRGTGSSEGLAAVAPEVKALIEFQHFNLMEPLPYESHFDAVFCRNVAIYFDKKTQLEVFGRLARCLKPGGTLFLGHSESMASSNMGFRYVQPAVYELSK
jgi:chemotaxis protein methyltransferase CheR